MSDDLPKIEVEHLNRVDTWGSEPKEDNGLKLCPFCGGNAAIIDQRLFWLIECVDTRCGASVGGVIVPEPLSEEAADNVPWDKIKGTAIARWNRRPT